MDLTKKLFASIARGAIALIFIVTGILNWAHFEGVKDYLISILKDWSLYMSGILWAEDLFLSLVDYATPILITATAIQIVCGLLIILGWRIQVSAFLILLVFVPMTIILRHFWFLTGQERDHELILFLKNLSIMGGLLTLMIFGKPEKKPPPSPPPTQPDDSFPI